MGATVELGCGGHGIDDGDGLPDVSSGRRWYQQVAPASEGEAPSFAEHIFRGGHDELPRTGAAQEIYTGESDDFADYAVNMDLDGDLDIIDVSNVDISSQDNPNPNPAPAPQVSAIAANSPTGFANVPSRLLPEWDYHPVVLDVVFPFGGTGKMHGQGFGDINGDGVPDLLRRDGIWLWQKSQASSRARARDAASWPSSCTVGKRRQNWVHSTCTPRIWMAMATPTSWLPWRRTTRGSPGTSKPNRSRSCSTSLRRHRGSVHRQQAGPVRVPGSVSVGPRS